MPIRLPEGIYQLGLSRRTFMTLRNASPPIVNVEDLLALSAIELMSVHGIGNTRYNEVIKSLESHGLIGIKGD